VVPQLRTFADRLRVAAGVTYLGDDSKARRHLGWRPRGMDDGLRDAIEWLLRDMLEPV
jgi:nucleoside-diphosphate-sugar epimerase